MVVEFAHYKQQVEELTEQLVAAEKSKRKPK